jgi:hypothetical protein
MAEDYTYDFDAKIAQMIGTSEDSSEDSDAE